MNKIVLTLLFICISFLSFSQSPTFSGSVIEEESNVKMADAIVSIEGTALASTTDADGKFSFNRIIPNGEHVVTVSKDGYELKLFMLNYTQGMSATTQGPIELAVTKQEKKRRKKLTKSAENLAKIETKAKEKKLKKARKEAEKREKEVRKETIKREKELAKQKKKLKKKNKDVVVSYENVGGVEEKNAEVPVETYDDGFSALQIKYANIIGVTPAEITNLALYQFIDGWMGTPYVLGGSQKDGIDCSSFTQRLYTSVMDLYIARTAEAQKDSDQIYEFKSHEVADVLDLVFFYLGEDDSIGHVGVYLGNNKFVNATSRKTNGVSGVKIDDLSDPFWKSIFCCYGRITTGK